MAEQGKTRVMVVDDARLIRNFYRSILERDGYEVHEALNGLEALEKLMEQQVELLIVDINMPKMDGMTFLRKLRAGGGEAAGTPALVTSTEAKASDKDAARRAGANFYLVKPLKPEMLLAYVALMSGRRA